MALCPYYKWPNLPTRLVLWLWIRACTWDPAPTIKIANVYARIETETIMLCLIDMPIQTPIPPNRLSFHSFSEMFTSFPFLPALDSIILHRWTWKRMLTLIKYFILDPFYSGPMTSNFLRSWNQLIITQTQEEGSSSYPCKCLHTAIKCNNVCS